MRSSLLVGAICSCVVLVVGCSGPAVDVSDTEVVKAVDPENMDRSVRPGELGTLDAVVADLSFISLTVVMEVLVSLVEPGSWMVLLVKPQFEAGRQEASRGGGVVSDPDVWQRTVESVASAAQALGAAIMGVMVSPLRGAEGNVEFCVHLVAGSAAAGAVDAGAGSGEPDGVSPPAAAMIDRVIEDAVASTGGEPQQDRP